MTIWDKLKVEHPLKISPIASVQTCLTPDSEAWLERHHSFITIMKTDPFLITSYNSTPKTGILKICQHLFGNLHTLLVICQFRSNLSTASVYKVEITDVSIDGASSTKFSWQRTRTVSNKVSSLTAVYLRGRRHLFWNFWTRFLPHVPWQFLSTQHNSFCHWSCTRSFFSIGCLKWYRLQFFQPTFS